MQSTEYGGEAEDSRIGLAWIYLPSINTKRMDTDEAVD